MTPKDNPTTINTAHVDTKALNMRHQQANLSMVRAMNTINRLFVARQESYLWPYINSIKTKVLFSINSLLQYKLIGM